MTLAVVMCVSKRNGMRNQRRLLKWTSWIAALVMSTALQGCHHEPGTDDAATGSTPRSAVSAVRYVAVSEQRVTDRLDLSAKVEPDPARMFRVLPPASGRVLAIKVKPGDTVTRGAMLATIDSADAAAAQTDLTKARIEATRAQRAADRQKVLLDHGAIAEKDYVDAKAASDSANAELERAKQHLTVLGIDVVSLKDGIPLLSPSKGIVLTVSAAPGEFSKSLDNSDPLMTIADLSIVWIVGDVFEKDIAKVQSGTKVTVTVDSFPGHQWTGRIDSVAGVLDPVTRTLKVRVALANPGEKLKPEMFAAIHIDMGSRKALVVPASAVIHEGQNTIVFVDKDGKPAQQNVTTGRVIDGTVEITSGIEEGHRVAVDGAELLTGGASQP